MTRPARLPVSVLLAAAIVAAGCAARGPQTWRLAPQDRAQVLAPPGVKSADVARAVFTLSAPTWRLPCAPSGSAVKMEKHGKRVRVTVDRAELQRQPAGWIAEWTAAAEDKGCLAQGAGLPFAMRILDSVPLDPSSVRRLLHADSARTGYTDLGQETRLQVISPILKQGADPETPIVQVGPTTGNDHSLQVTVQTPDTQYGVEVAWYAFEPRPDHNGSTIVPLGAERRIAERTQPAAAPLTNWLQFGPSAAFYRLYYKADLADNSLTEIIIAAPSRAELDRRTERVKSDLTLCQQTDPEMCVVIPRRVAVNPDMLVTVNGVETHLIAGSRVRHAIQAGGGPKQPRDVLPQLAVQKPFAGALKPVVFDRTKPDILDLVLLGGESISWK